MYICTGLIFVIVSLTEYSRILQLIFDITKICGLTDVPFYVIWLLFALVWAALFIDFLHRHHAKRVQDGGIVYIALV